jgi:hypothetical protein
MTVPRTRHASEFHSTWSPSDDARIEERLRNAGPKRPAARVHFHSHERPFAREVEKFFAIPAPSGLRATAIRDRPFRASARTLRKGPYIDFRLAGLIRPVSDPASIRRELPLGLIEFGAQQRNGFAVTGKRQEPQIAVGFRVAIGVARRTRSSEADAPRWEFPVGVSGGSFRLG